MNYCEHVITKGARRGQTCDRFCSGKYCRLHAQANDKKATRAERADRDLGAFLDRSRTRGKQTVAPIQQEVKKSDFAITINSNKTIDGLSDYQADIFHLLSEYLFDNGGLMDFVIGRDCELNPADIISEYIDSSFEVGGEFGRLHLHAILQIKHRSKIRIDIDRLREYINDALGYKCHLNVQSIKTGGSVGDWLRYMRKKRTEA